MLTMAKAAYGKGTARKCIGPVNISYPVLILNFYMKNNQPTLKISLILLIFKDTNRTL